MKTHMYYRLLYFRIISIWILLSACQPAQDAHPPLPKITIPPSSPVPNETSHSCTSELLVEKTVHLATQTQLFECRQQLTKTSPVLKTKRCVTELIPKHYKIELSKRSFFGELNRTDEKAFSVEKEVELEQGKLEIARRTVDQLAQSIDMKDKIKSKQQRAVTKAENELLHLSASDPRYTEEESAYQQVVEEHRRSVDDYVKAVQDYATARKNEETLYRRFVQLVTKFREYRHREEPCPESKNIFIDNMKETEKNSTPKQIPTNVESAHRDTHTTEGLQLQ